jgi:hypothetical protein
MEKMKGLNVNVSEDGVFLLFEASTGKTALINAETIADGRGPVTREAILDWMEDQRQLKRDPKTGLSRD